MSLVLPCESQSLFEPKKTPVGIAYRFYTEKDTEAVKLKLPQVSQSHTGNK